MATTNLIVDYLVIGVSSFVWISPLLYLVYGDSWITIFSTNNVVAGFGILGLVYIIGISIARLADDILDYWNDKWGIEVFGTNADPTYHQRLNFVICKSENATNYLSYRRSIIRITRACSINFLAGTLGWILVAVLKPIALLNGTELFIATLSALLAFLLLRSLPVVLKGYYSTIKDLYIYLKNREEKNESY